jgi:hypothetical protein
MSCPGISKSLLVVGIFALPSFAFAAELKPETLKAWERYIERTEKRIHSEIESGDSFVVGDFFPSEKASEFRRNVGAGKVFVKKMQTRDEEGKKIDVPKGIIHHWYGAIFVPGAELDEVVRWAKQYSDRHLYYEEVEDSKLLSQEGDVYKIFLRLRRKKVITVHYNSEHVVSYRLIGSGRTFAKSTSTKIAELEDVGKPEEREKPLGKDRGFLWRLNSYWRYHQEDGGVLIDCESVSLSRGVPPGVGWLVKQYVNSVPKESLENTLVPFRSEFVKP